MMEARSKVVIVNKVVHFRPLARMRELATQLDIELLLAYRGDILPVSRILALIGWELAAGDEIEVIVRARGDTAPLLAAVVAFIQEGCGEK